MQNIVIMGTLGTDPQLNGEGDRAWMNLRVAVNYSEKVAGNWEKKTQWYGVTVFGRRAATLAEKLKKGDRVCVSGEFSLTEKESRSFANIRAHEVEPIWNGKSSESGGRGRSDQASGGDDLPF